MIISIGDLCIDRYVTTGEKLLGGIATNFALLVHDLEEPVKLLAAVGDDENARLILQRLQEAGLDTSTLHQLPGNTALQNVRLMGKERDYCGFIPGVYEDFTLRANDFELIKQAQAVTAPLTDGLKKVFEQVMHADLGAALKVADFSRDADIEGFIHGDVLAMLLHYLDKLDIAFIGGDQTLVNMIETIAHAHPDKILILTLGPHGTIAFHDRRMHRQPAPQIRDLVDTTGCGDAFRAGFLTNYLRHQNIRQALQAGMQLAGQAATYLGGSPHAIFRKH